MLIKQGDGKIINIIKENDEAIHDKAKKALEKAKNFFDKDGNKIDSTIDAEKN
jgi:hypothetical protein